ncbi:MAG TPA: TonB-dependent receptor [Kofleriaceae bacterium]
MVARWIAAAIVLGATAAVHADVRVVTGTVVDRTTREAIAGAVVLGERRSATTATDGTFAIAVEPNERELTVTAAGYALQSVQLAAGPITIALDPAENEAIEVTGRAPDPPKAQAHALTADDIHSLPGSGNDALRAAQALPGVARLPYSFGGIVLRGSSPRDNDVFLDGIEVPLAFHFGGLTSFYPSNMLAQLNVINGGFDAMYGRAQGGIVELTSREPRTDAWRLGGSVGLLDSSVWAEGPVQDGGIMFGVRRSYFDLVAGPLVPSTIPLPSYLDAQVRASFGDPERNGRITPMLFASLDQVSIQSTTSDGLGETTSLSAYFIRAGVPYLRQWGPLALRAVAWLGAQSLDFTSATSTTTESFSRPSYPAGGRSDLSYAFPWGELRSGLDVQGGYVAHSENGLGHAGDILQQDNGTTTLWWVDAALWSDARVDVADGRLSIKPGLRVDHYGLSNEFVVDPRLAVREQLTEQLVLRETIGRFHQPPTPGDVDPNGGNPALKSSYFDQAALGVDAALGKGWSGSITGYYNVGHNLGVQIGQGGPEFSDLGALGPTLELLLEKQLGLAFYRENIGRALDRGIELSIKHTTDTWLWVLGYTLSYADRTDDPAILIGWRPFELDQRHNVNLIGSRRFRAWTVGARVQLVSGMPYTPGPFPGVPPAPPFSANLPWFFQLDVRVDHRWHRDWGDINVYADIQNVTDYPNVEGREVSDGVEKDISGLPIAPFIGIEWIPK